MYHIYFIFCGDTYNTFLLLCNGIKRSLLTISFWQIIVSCGLVFLYQFFMSVATVISGNYIDGIDVLTLSEQSRFKPNQMVSIYT